MAQMSPPKKRVVADRLLVWLKEHDVKRWSQMHDVLREVHEDLGEEIFNLWKGYELLRAMGRIALVSPNGRKGGYVVSYSPLIEQPIPVPDSLPICSRETCPIVNGLDRIFTQ